MRYLLVMVHGKLLVRCKLRNLLVMVHGKLLVRCKLRNLLVMVHGKLLVRCKMRYLLVNEVHISRGPWWLLFLPRPAGRMVRAVAVATLLLHSLVPLHKIKCKISNNY